MVNIDAVAEYLTQYVAAYRREYEAFVSVPPRGGGYPRLAISPLLGTTFLTCMVARDGYALAESSRPPAYSWEIAGGPALMTDFEDSHVPQEVMSFLRAENLIGKPIGIFRIVAKEGIPDDIWRGELGRPVASTEVKCQSCNVRVERYDISWNSLIQHLTFGAYGLILNIPLPTESSPFWQPHVVRDLGFFPADRNNKRFFNLLELGPHLDPAAWDVRSLPTRVAFDVRQDFAWAFSAQARGTGGTISLGPPRAWIERFHDRLRLLGDCIERFSALLRSSESNEAVFHDFLKANPILLDVYGDVESKPRFSYPDGDSPLGKAYVEPDFIVRYLGQSYKLIELERPSKNLATARGESRAGVTQAAFQIAEWTTFIQKHYDLLKDRFPGISSNYSSTIIMSRSTEASVGVGRQMQEYRTLLRNQLNVDEILTYDDLLERAAGAYARLAALAPTG